MYHLDREAAPALQPKQTSIKNIYAIWTTSLLVVYYAFDKINEFNYYSMKLSYSMALLLPPDLSNLATSKSRIDGETEKPRLRRASRSSVVSILPLRSRSNLSKIAWKRNHQ